MEYLIIIGVIIIVIILTKDNSKKTNFYYNFDINDLNIDEGQKINLWNKPNTNQINFYTRGHGEGEGLIGTKNNKTITNHLKNGKSYTAIILKKTKYIIGIDIKLN